ncbi:hypothetical protein PCO31111_03394 [Pandoraea communis]|uniref:Uncharacterized protein n=1 Tax=Pandoraea communis TaxID=2508297 RepID=A0A5E4WPY8_9BURK|nr:hypothetical protein PCO31111_03394 [Pandoraea communis]
MVCIVIQEDIKLLACISKVVRIGVNNFLDLLFDIGQIRHLQFSLPIKVQRLSSILFQLGNQIFDLAGDFRELITVSNCIADVLGTRVNV